MKTAGAGALTLYRKIAYASPAFSLAVVGIPVYVYIPKFYSDVVGLDVALLGLVLLSVRIFDALTDPAIGYLSDRTRSSHGRRRPYIAVGAVFVALTMLMLFNPPSAASAFKTVWFTVAIYALFLSWTLVAVPLESLGPEMTFDYNERISLFALRDGFLIAGTLAAAVSPSLVQWLGGFGPDAAGERARFFWIAVLYAPLLVGTALWCVSAVRERPPAAADAPLGLLEGLRQVGRNRPFIILLAAYTISAIGNNLPATLILFYVEYVLGSARADVFLMLYFVVGILCLPAWIRVAARIGKKKAWIAAMAVNTGAFAGVFWLRPGDTGLYGFLVLVSGVGFGATLALPSAIQADVIDYDELLTGRRREGQYIGLWSISKKLAAALGVGIALAILGWAGYRPNQAQTEAVQLTLRVLYALVPALCNLAALLIVLAYPLDKAMHARIRSAVAARRRGLAVDDPLAGDAAAARAARQEVPLCKTC